MEVEIRHRRLYGFWHSKVCNALTILIIVGIFLLSFSESVYLPLICIALAFFAFIAYTLWIWIGKPRQIVINNWLSDAAFYMVFYFLVITAIRPENEVWYIIPVIGTMLILIVSLIWNKDEVFIINE